MNICTENAWTLLRCEIYESQIILNLRLNGFSSLPCKRLLINIKIKDQQSSSKSFHLEQLTFPKICSIPTRKSDAKHFCSCLRWCGFKCTHTLRSNLSEAHFINEALDLRTISNLCWELNNGRTLKTQFLNQFYNKSEERNIVWYFYINLKKKCSSGNKVILNTVGCLPLVYSTVESKEEAKNTNNKYKKVCNSPISSTCAVKNYINLQ